MKLSSAAEPQKDSTQSLEIKPLIPFLGDYIWTWTASAKPQTQVKEWRVKAGANEYLFTFEGAQK